MTALLRDDAGDADLWHRILILAPIGRDAELMCSVLGETGIKCVRCQHGDELCAKLAAGAGGGLINREALDANLMTRRGRPFPEQPPWSDMPVVILTGQPLTEPAK